MKQKVLGMGAFTYAMLGPCTSCESAWCWRRWTSEDLPHLESRLKRLSTVIYSTSPYPSSGARWTTWSASWQLFNLLLKKSNGGPTASLANLRWCLANLTDGKAFDNFYPNFIILIFSSLQVDHIALWTRLSFW